MYSDAWYYFAHFLIHFNSEYFSDVYQTTIHVAMMYKLFQREHPSTRCFYIKPVWCDSISDRLAGLQAAGPEVIANKCWLAKSRWLFDIFCELNPIYYVCLLKFFNFRLVFIASRRVLESTLIRAKVTLSSTRYTTIRTTLLKSSSTFRISYILRFLD